MEPALTPALTLDGIGAGVDGPLEFEPVMRQYQGMVFGLAYHFLADRGLAEEVAQDVFLSLFHNFKAIQSGQHALAWLRRVTAQRSIDEARRRKRRPQENIADVPEPAAPGTRNDVLGELTLWRMVGSLPEIPRMVVILRYQEDLSPAEIAAALDRPLATVKSDLQRALALLREKSARRLGESYERF